MKNAKRVTAILLSVILIVMIFPLAAFAKDAQKVESIDISVKKPHANAKYSEEMTEYHASVKKDSGFTVANEAWLKIKDDGTGTDIGEKFEVGGTYALVVTLKLSKGYKLPKDLSKLPLILSFTGENQEKAKYVKTEDFKYENGTYEISASEPTPDVYVSFTYAIKLDEITAKKLDIKVKAPVGDEAYSKDQKILPEYLATGESECLTVEKSAWLYIREDGKGTIMEMFAPGENYILSVGVKLKKGCVLPEDITDIAFKIDFDTQEDVVLSKKDYREPQKFDPTETGTYTIHTHKSKDGIREFDFIFAMKPFNAIESDIAFFYKKPAAGDKYSTDDVSYYFEADAADGVDAVGTVWEKKVFGPIYKTAKSFEDGGKYRVTVMLHVKEGYELNKDLSKISVTLTDEKYNRIKLDPSQFKIVPYYVGDILSGYKLIYEISVNAKAQVIETQESSKQPVAQSQTEDQKQAPDTGAPLGAGFAVLAILGAGAMVVSKKHKR